MFDPAMSQATDNLSMPLLSQLRKTTTSPIFLHPIKWSKLHLALLRVRGLDKDYPVEQVIGSDLHGLSNSIEDKAMADILRQISAGDLNLTWYMETLREVNEDKLSEAFLEGSLLGVSGVWFRQIYEAKGYSKHLHRWRPSNASDRVLYFRFGNEKPQRLLCEFCIHNWHNENEYPASFPLIAVLGQSRDYYEPRLTPYVRFLDFEHWQRKRKTDDRDVEEVALLIALAQKQAEVLNASRFAEDDLVSRSDERLHVFHPVIMIATNTTIRFIKAHITLEYLKTLEDPSTPLQHDLVIKRAIPIDMTNYENVPQLIAAMAAVVDDFTMHVDPLLAKRLPVPINPIIPQDYDTGTPFSLPRRHRKIEPRMRRLKPKSTNVV